jgi:hypothetical protein
MEKVDGLRGEWAEWRMREGLHCVQHTLLLPVSAATDSFRARDINDWLLWYSVLGGVAALLAVGMRFGRLNTVEGSSPGARSDSSSDSFI